MEKLCVGQHVSQILNLQVVQAQCVDVLVDRGVVGVRVFLFTRPSVSIAIDVTFLYL